MKKNRIIILLGALVLLVGAGIMGYQLWQDLSAKASYEALREGFIEVHPEVGEDDWEAAFTVNFDGLRAINPDVVGWLVVDGNDTISYPILQGQTDDSYIHTNLYGESIKSGSIFLESGNAADFSDSYSIIYGHNMRDGSMFGSLKQYSEEGYYEAHPSFTIYTPQGAYHYAIFGYEDVPEDDMVYSVGYGANEVFAQFIASLYQKSYKNTGVVATETDRIVTLSTCSTSGRRFVLHGVLQEIRP